MIKNGKTIHPLPNRQYPAHHAAVERFNDPVVLFCTVCILNRGALLNNAASVQAVQMAWQEASQWRVGEFLFMPDHLHFFCVPGGAASGERETVVPLLEALGESVSSCIEWPVADGCVGHPDAGCGSLHGEAFLYATESGQKRIGAPLGGMAAQRCFAGGSVVMPRDRGDGGHAKRLVNPSPSMESWQMCHIVFRRDQEV